LNKVEVMDLLEEIKREYPFFDVSDENIERHYKYLQDYPFDAAMRNVEEYIKTDTRRVHPGVGDIRGRLGDQLDSQKSKQSAESYMVRMEQARNSESAPPDGYWELLKSKLSGGAT
jgi:hypothetical protein